MRADELTLRRLLGDREQRVGRAGERRHDDERPSRDAAAHDLGGAFDGRRITDRRAAELDDDHALATTPRGDEQLGVEHRSAGGAANRVVA